MVAKTILLAKASSVGGQRLARRQIGGAADGRPQFVVTGHLEHVRVHQFLRPAHRPAAFQAFVADVAHPAVNVGAAPLPGQVPPFVVLRRRQALSADQRTYLRQEATTQSNLRKIDGHWNLCNRLQPSPGDRTIAALEQLLRLRQSVLNQTDKELTGAPTPAASPASAAKSLMVLYDVASTEQPKN
jgi:hypothetical protein